MAEELSSAQCPLCDGSAVEVSAAFGPSEKRAGWDLHRCTLCATRFVHPLPSDEELAAAYPEDFYGELNTSSGMIRDLFLKERLSRLGRVAGKKVLDFGCGDGAFLGLAKSAGADVFGVEVSAQGRRICQQAGITAAEDLEELARGLGVQPGAQADAQAGRNDHSLKMDWITLWQVFEHLTNPRQTLEALKGLLAPDGRLLLSLPNVESWEARRFGAHWFHLDLPRHLIFPPAAALEMFLAQSGFIIEQRWDFCFEYDTFGLLQSALNQAGLPHNALYHAVKGKGEGRKEGRLASLFSAALLTPGALMLSYALGQLGKAGTYTLVARLA
jgi:SAM-dependent methyltransferase